MAKKLVFDYEFDAAAQTVTLTDDVYPKRRLLMITNITDGEIIYLFNDSTKGGTFAFDYTDYKTTITLDYDTTGMSDDDDLQIFVEWDNQTVEFDESYVDPVSKIRVSQPENLIDTDFEYGLQSTKWETLELTKNIPTFYSRNGDISFTITDITVQEGSKTVTVVTQFEHGLQRGTPILVQGTSSSLCDGGFTSLSVIDDFTFTYQAKSTLGFSGSIKTTNTEVFQGSIYSGTEFKIRSISGITSDGVSNGSTLTVTTEYPTDFVDGTQFALTNSFAAVEQQFSTDDVEFENTFTTTKTVTIGQTSDNTSNSNITMSTIQPNTWQATDNRSIYIDPDEVSVNNGDIYFTNGHGRNYTTTYLRAFCFYYNIPFGETEIGGLTRGKFYIARYIDANRLRIYPILQNSGQTSNVNAMFGYNMLNDTNKITITSIPSSGLFKHQFLGGYVSTRSYSREFNFYANYYQSGLYNFNYPALSHINTFTQFDALYDRTATAGKHLIASDSSESFGLTSSTIFTRYGASVGSFEALSPSPSTIYYVYNGNYFSYNPSISGRGTQRVNNVQNELISIPVILRNDRNSIFLQDHGYSTGDAVTYSVTSGTGPSGLVDGRQYTVVVVNSNRFRLQYNGSDVNITDYGVDGSVLSFAALGYRNTGDTIKIAGNVFQEGDEVRYLTNSGTAIGGLVDNTTYYVYRKSGDRFRLASNPNLVTGNAINNFYTVFSSFYWNTSTNIINTLQYPVNVTTGNAVLYSQTGGIQAGLLKNGEMYYINKQGTYTFSLHYTKADALADTNRISVGPPRTTAVSFTETYAIDLTSRPATNETQAFSSSFVGAADGNYALESTAADQMSFTLSSNATVKGRKIETTIDKSLLTSIGGFYYRDHGFALGADVTYTSTQTHFTGLTSGSTYYVIPQTRNTFQLAASQSDAINGTAITFTDTSSTSLATDAIEFQGNSIVAAAIGAGEVSVSAGSNVVIGNSTLFNSLFKSGDTIKISPPAEIYNYYTESSTDYLYFREIGTSTAVSHGLSTGDAVRLSTVGTSLQSPLSAEKIYYVRVINSTTVQLYYSSTDAVSNTNVIQLNYGINSTWRVEPLSDVGQPIEKVIDYVNSNTQLEVTEPFTDAITDGNYYINSQLLLRPDGFALHRPYDGGVELIPPTNPDSQMIRQTRKYFRYQSGKGIQVSFAVNFSPTTQIDTAYYDASGDLIITTRFPHRLSENLEIEVSEATGSNASLFNGTRTVSSIVDDYTAVFDTGQTSSAGEVFSGNAEFYVKNWDNSDLKCGLFDDQNGLFFSYDGRNLSCCRRSSVRQIAGTVSVTFRSGDVYGTNTKFLSQVNQGSYIVIKGQTYLVTKISSDTLLHIAPSYRGVDAQGVIVTITETTAVTQNNWNLDKADGTGYTGFQLDLSKIQMAYIDYSWYGAGKVRFGFKDQHGKVQYVHEFVHGNFKTEAYMRSGNIPARYEIQNNGQPSYVPALAHWGTSVIMDGRFDDDKAYVFNASGNNITTTGSSSLTFTGQIETRDQYYQIFQGQGYFAPLGYAIHVETPDPQLQGVFEGVGVTGADLQSNTEAANPDDFFATPYQPYMASVFCGIYGESGKSSWQTRNLLLIDERPTAVATPDPQTGLTTSTYTLDLDVGDGQSTQVGRDIPLISVRLAPSVDTSTVGRLGEREIINRMQLILSQVSILTTHTCEVKLILNGQLSTNAWQRVTNPSLSELIYHSGNDVIGGGAALFSFRAAGDTGATRSQQLTTQELGDVATLGNSILGGDQAFPDGPDVLTVVATLTEDPSTVSTSTPFNVSGRISWSESQA